MFDYLSSVIVNLPVSFCFWSNFIYKKCYARVKKSKGSHSKAAGLLFAVALEDLEQLDNIRVCHQRSAALQHK